MLLIAQLFRGGVGAINQILVGQYKITRGRGFGLLLGVFFIAFDQAGAADDEEPPNDTAGEEHGDDAGKSHDGGEVCVG